MRKSGEIFKIYSKKGTIKQKMFITQFIFFMIPFMMAAFVIIAFLNRSMLDRYEKEKQQQISIATQDINKEIFMYINKSKVVPFNVSIISYIKASTKGNVSKIFEFQQLMNSFLIELQASSNNIEVMKFYVSDYPFEGTPYIEDIKAVPEEVKELVLQSDFDTIIWDDNIQYDNKGRGLIVFYRNITSVYSRPSVLRVSVPVFSIERIIERIDLQEDEIILIKGSAGNIVSLKGTTIEKLVEDNYFKVQGGMIPNESSIIMGLPYSKIVQLYGIRIIIGVSALIILLLFSLYICQVTTTHITSNLEIFLDEISVNEEIELKEYMFSISVGDDEISTIRRKFIQLIHKIKTIYEDLLTSQRKNDQLQIELLQERINPHLLYNSLNAIKISCYRKQDKETVELIDCMTQYYRLALNNGLNKITLKKELELTEEYIKIINYTYLKSYQLIINMDKKLNNKVIMKNILQPIVENAVFHGLNAVQHDGIITITAKEEKNMIIIEIVDNGMGMSQSKLDMVLKGEYTSFNGGYGFKNCRERIQLCYGPNSKLLMESKINEGTKVTIILEY